MVRLEITELRKIAQLSALLLDEKEVEEFYARLKKVLEYIDELDSLQVAAEHKGVQNINVLREDRIAVTDSLLLLKQAPLLYGSYFVVPKVQ